MPKPERPKLTTEVPGRPPRAPETHKGQAGHVALIAGSRGMSGAAVLSALGALRGGAGLVRVYCPASIQAIVAGSEPCLMTVPLPEDVDGRLSLASHAGPIDLDWPDVLALGPGLGQNATLPNLIQSILVGCNRPLVVDADGFNNLATLPGNVWQSRAGRSTVITPHPGEMARLRRAAGLPELRGDDDETRVRIAHEYATYAGVTVVLKGHRTVVCTADEAYINTSGNPGMATGGMGDVLTGLIAALLGQGLSAFDAGRLGVFCHGLAADHCKREIAPIGYLARDVADALPGALADASQPRIGFR